MLADDDDDDDIARLFGRGIGGRATPVLLTAQLLGGIGDKSRPSAFHIPPFTCVNGRC